MARSSALSEGAYTTPSCLTVACISTGGPSTTTPRPTARRALAHPSYALYYLLLYPLSCHALLLVVLVIPLAPLAYLSIKETPSTHRPLGTGLSTPDEMLVQHDVVLG